MFLRLFLLIAIVPALELYLLMKLGGAIGAGPTLLLILLTGVVGASLARREGLSVLQQLQQDLARGLPPAHRLIEGLLVFAGGLLLLAPGIVTDFVGLLLVFGPTRRLLAPRVSEALAARVQVQAFGAGPSAGDPFGGAARREPFQGAFGPTGEPPRPPPERRREHPFADPFDDLP